jgi:hypothetical protein
LLSAAAHREYEVFFWLHERREKETKKTKGLSPNKSYPKHPREEQ